MAKPHILRYEAAIPHQEWTFRQKKGYGGQLVALWLSCFAESVLDRTRGSQFKKLLRPSIFSFEAFGQVPQGETANYTAACLNLALRVEHEWAGFEAKFSKVF
jgi:hypothetical protein